MYFQGEGGRGGPGSRFIVHFLCTIPLRSAVLQRGSLFFRLIFTGAAHRDGHFVILSGEGGNTGFWRRGGIFMRRGELQDRWSERGWELTAGPTMGISKKKSLMACPANTVFWGDFMKKQREGISGRISSRTDRVKEGESWQWQDPAIWYISGNRTLCLMVHRGNDDVLIDVFMDQTTGIVWLENTFASSFFKFMM